jgi:hypothetical protein
VSALTRLDAAHLRHDGPLSQEDRSAALYGEAEAMLNAAGEARFWRSFASGQIRAIRKTREHGEDPAHLFNDLRRYRRDFSKWNRLLHNLKRIEAMRSAGERVKRGREILAAAERGA